MKTTIEKYAARADELYKEVSFGDVATIDWAAIIELIFSLFAGCFLMTPRRMEREAADPPKRFLRVLDNLANEHCPDGTDKEMFKAILLDLGRELTEKDARAGMKEAGQ